MSFYDSARSESRSDIRIAQDIHFDGRLIERYGFKMGIGVKKILSEMIENVDDNVTLVSDSNFPNNEFLIRFSEMNFRVIYNTIDHVFVTALPFDLVYDKPKKASKVKIKDIRRRTAHYKKLLNKFTLEEEDDSES